MGSNYISKEKSVGNNTTRRNFVWGVSLFSFFTTLAVAIGFKPSSSRNIISCGPESNTKKLRMLTEDGRLVEIDASHVPSDKKQITNPELQHWIKK